MTLAKMAHSPRPVARSAEVPRGQTHDFAPGVRDRARTWLLSLPALSGHGAVPLDQPSKRRTYMPDMARTLKPSATYSVYIVDGKTATPAEATAASVIRT